MKSAYQLIRLRAKTVQDLKRLMSLTAKGSLNDLIVSMIRITSAHYDGLKETGWDDVRGGGTAET
jgi:hypothetical protein